MQTLRKRTLKNTPTDTSLVRGDCGLSLNRDESLSVADLKTFFNNPEVNCQQRIVGLKDVVYVRSIDGKPLMPCSRSKARKLRRNNKAVVVKMYPYTIQLTFECENQVQGVKRGMDTGYKFIGVSCITEKKEIFSVTLTLDDKTSGRITEKRMYRRGRRNKLRYREPRFLNRKKKEGWLPPSVQRRYDMHKRLLELTYFILPISETTIEIANFDIQKIENPEIEGKGYQEGDILGYQNMRSYLMAREHGLCQICKKPFTKGDTSHIHHCEQRKDQGSNRAKNLAIIHEKCHGKLHKKGVKISPPKKIKAETFMSIIQKRFKQDFSGANFTFGYITFCKRQEYGIEKSHNNDAFIIAGGTTQERCKRLNITQKHRNNRAIQLNRKGYKPSIRRQRYPIQPHDLIWINNKKHVVKGTQNKGSYILVEGSKKVLPTNQIEKVYHFGGLVYEK